MTTQIRTEPTAPTFTETERCRACGKKSLESVLDLGTQYLPRFPKEMDTTLPRAPLELGRCVSCGLLQLRHDTNPDLLYRQFWYRSSVNNTMRTALSEIVADGLKWHQKGVWVDIGANDGWLLKCLPKQFHKVAFEPALNFRKDLDEAADLVVLDYFKRNPDVAHTANIITSAAMFYDVPNPGQFIDDIRDTLAPGGVWINQLNDSPTMMAQNAFDAICHEHLMYYDIPVLSALYEKHGMTIVRVTHNDVNGGSVRVEAMRSCDAPKKADLSHYHGVTKDEAFAFANRVRRWKNQMRYVLMGLHGQGPIWCYGASTKGTVLLQYLDCNDLFGSVAERNPEKIGLRMVGSWLPIVSEHTFRTEKPRVAMVLPWAFKNEFIRREQQTMSNGTALLFPLPQIDVEV